MSAAPPHDGDYDVDLAEVQSLALSGLPKLPVASYLLLAFERDARPGAWLDAVLGRVCTGEPDGTAVGATNVAFSHRGLAAFGLEPRTLGAFGPAFREGMTGSPHRSWDMGDTDVCAPPEWTWGNAVNPVDAVLLLFGATDGDLVQAEASAMRAAGTAKLRLVTDGPLRAAWPTRPAVGGLREHFGFVDGLSQPEFRRRHDDDHDEHLAPGELLLGYPDSTGAIASTPTVAASESARQAGLKVTPDGERCDLGRGGSYLVFRQLEQRVLAFWQFVESAAASLGSLERTAAKFIGRWRNGTPLTLSSEQPDDMNVPIDANGFQYVRDGDSAGYGCPIGAHIRRSNPRDALPGLRERHSLAKVRRHRILRRGRPYGTAVPGWPDPAEMLKHRDADQDGGRGLHFLCLNADIEQQFEFVHQRWLNDPTFVNEFTDEVDPILGRRRADTRFVVPEQPTPRLVVQPPTLQRFVTVRGGEYFFLPSRSALRYLAGIGR
jgi:Dyp-type peroxidase family